MKRRSLFYFSLGAVSSLLIRPVRSQNGSVLHRLSPAAIDPTIGLEMELDGQTSQTSNRQALVGAIDRSLSYLRTNAAAAAYRQYPVSGITLSRVRRSLVRFRQLVLTRSASDLQSAVQREFDFYQSVGRDGQGTVDFTGYFEPTYAASRVATSEYRYPLYRLPANFSQWSHPHPTRLQLEGEDGLQGERGQLRGLGLVWLRDRLEAFLAQVQGSARLQLSDGSSMSVGVAGHTDHPYTGVGRQLVNDGKLMPTELTLPNVIAYFREHPADLNQYLPLNRRFIFFWETAGAPATGSLGVPVTAERSIATDRALMPPGALALIHTELPCPNPQGQLQPQLVSRYVLDQDTGGAIRGAGRVDIFMGSGETAGDRAGLVNATGQLYYLLLKDSSY
jgi:membrane-bound lytic murein transglycosylase A